MNKLKHINKMASVYRHATLLSGISHNLFICILVSLALPTRERAAAVHGARAAAVQGERLTKEYHLRQGALRGLIVQPGRQHELQSVEMFLGIPYATPPVGHLRFMPPVTAVPWPGVRNATQFAPVCPQMLPVFHKEDPPSHGRQQYMSRLLPFLNHESEDCLYLNIYVPNQEHKPKKMPVLVFIHGDSFEWSSGNPYDGRVLAGYGNVMVITINFRLGILGFMKPSLTDHAYGNNGLLDQLAALQWIKDNIEDLNGDPESVTLMGHGTGSACVHYHMLSPISEGLFHRAILMSGSALADWALTQTPAQYTVQVAQHLGCNLTGQNIMACMQNRRLADIKKVQILARKFATPLGPIAAGAFIPTEPANTIHSYPNIYSKYEMLSGVTELESYHEFGVIALAHGVLDTERDELLAQYAQLQYAAPEHAVRDILHKYAPNHKDPQSWSVYENRELVLEALSDARTVAPQQLTAYQHCASNARSYFYVFGHNSEHTDYAALSKSVHGEEVPYVLGVPLGGAHTHLHQEYTAKERLLSEVVMRLWTNFVKGGTPNADRKEQYLTLGNEDWILYDIDWPEYNVQHQSFLRLDVPPSNFVRSFYRANYTKFWNEVLPNKMKNYAVSPLFEYEPVATTTRPRKTLPSPVQSERHNSRPTAPQRPQIYSPTYGRPKQYIPHSTSTTQDIYKEIKSIKKPSDFKEDQIKRRDFPLTRSGTLETTTEAPVKTSSATIGIIITIGCIFLVVNIFIFAALYLKRRRLQARERELKRDNNVNSDNLEANEVVSKSKEMKTFEKLKTGCNALKTLNWNKLHKSEEKSKKDKFESCKTPKSDDSGGFGHRFKLRRHLSSSTIDAHTKVRDWIANEIINRCSPPITRKTNFNLDGDPQNIFAMKKNFAQSDEVLINKKNNSTRSKESLNLSLHGDLDSTLSSQKNSTKRTKTFKKTTSTSTHETHSSIGTRREQNKKNDTFTASKSNESIDSEARQLNKVSVAIDATPAARTSAILQQKPIEFSKSLDMVEKIPIDDRTEVKALKRSNTEKKYIEQVESTSNLPKTTDRSDNRTFTSIINLSVTEQLKPKTTSPADIVRISHKHSVSDPVKDLNYDAIAQYTDFPDIPPPTVFRNDVNVTSQEEIKRIAPMTAAEALLTIQRRNYPKVLPDLPKSFSTNQKRLSLQPNSFQSFKSYLSGDNKDNVSLTKIPPQPPPRTTSTLDRRQGFKNSKTSGTSSFDSGNTSFSSIYENKIQNHDDYCNFDAISSVLTEIRQDKIGNISLSRINCDHGNFPTQPTKREIPKIIIAANDIPNIHEPNIIIKQTIAKSLADIQANAPRIRLADNFHGINSEFERCSSVLSITSDDLDDDFEDQFSDTKLIEALVGGMNTSINPKDIPDSKGPDNSFEKKLEIIPVKVNNTPQQLNKNYEHSKYCSKDILPDVSDLEKTAQIKQKFSLNKLQNRSESFDRPLEKAINVKDKKNPKTPTFISKSSNIKTSATIFPKLPKQKNTNIKKIPLEHSYSGSSNDTESSTGTVKKVEIKK